MLSSFVETNALVEEVAAELIVVPPREVPAVLMEAV